MEDLLIQMITKVEEQRLLVEHECSMLRELLKPWPQDKPIKDETDTHQAEESNVNESNQEKDLSQADLLALDQVNQLLNKARWTRVAKSKKASDDNDLVIPEPEVAAPFENHTLKVAPTDKKSSVSSKIVSTVSGEKHLGPHNEKSPRDSLSRTVKSGLVKKVKPSCPVPQSGRNPVSRPTSAASSGSFGKKREYVPAHVKAPFKTEVNSRVPNRKFNHLKKNQSSRKMGGTLSTVPRTQQAHPLEATHFKTLPGIKTQTQTGDPNKFPHKEVEPNVHSSDKLNLQIPETQVSHNIFETTDQDAQSHGEDRRPPGAVAKESHCQEETDSQVPCNVKAWTLKDNSCDLKIPAKLKKLYSTNVTLLKQCHDSKLCKKVSNVDPAQSFMEKLKSQTEIHEELWIRGRALSCLKAHNLMHEILQSLRLHTITEKSSYEVMYRAKKMLEFILFMFGKLEEEADYFSRVQFRSLVPSTLDVCVDESPLHALTNFVEKAISDTQSPVFPESSESRILKMNLGCSKQWIHLKFMEIYYKIQQSIINMAEKEWWYLASSDLSDLSVLQLVHGLMTTSGEHLPIQVDNLSS